MKDLWSRVKKSQLNTDKIQVILEPWTKMPLIERKDSRQDKLLSLEERSEKVAKRYASLKNAAVEIFKLLEKNKELFQIEIDSPAWEEYVKFFDKIVTNYLRKIIGCSLSYLAENMDPSCQKEPLLEAQLELREPDLYYVPSLEQDDPEGLECLVEGMLKDIMQMAELIPRIKKTDETFVKELEKDDDIVAMKKEIMASVNKAIEQATDFCEIFEGEFYFFGLII